MPPPLKRSIFCNSGTEACELAIKLAKRHSVMNDKTGSYIVSLENSFHGFGGLSLTLTGQKRFKKKVAGYSIYPGVLHIPSPYCYRCNLEYPKCGIYCARALENICSNTRGTKTLHLLFTNQFKAREE
jgi:4-aminobutyrate aminotransferase-like enzyme